MALMTAAQREFVEAVTGLMYTNPFLPEWVELERRALGPDFKEHGPVWSSQVDSPAERDNIVRIEERMEKLVAELRPRLTSSARASERDLALYEDLVLFLLYERLSRPFLDYVSDSLAGRTSPLRAGFYDEFARGARELLAVPGREFASLGELPHLFACYFQIRRAFHLIFTFIVGGSMPTARLRAAAWQSIFTHDMRRYRRGRHARMGELATLITGPSGTGKELVARAIGLARYVPFEGRTRSFVEDFTRAFHPLNLSAMSPTLIESELFGHRKGAFTGAVADRVGWLELCSPLGSVFLDEIGELDVGIQVKLLRVLETRRFQRLGDAAPRDFQGKIIAATNRDLTAALAAGRFREDLYYRLCADTVRTPGLAEQIADSPGELTNLVRHIARGVAGEEEADRLAGETLEVIERDLGPGYSWPGNIRELAQCVRNVMVRKSYRPPPRPARPAPGLEGLQQELAAGELSADELVGRYAALVYARCGSYEEAARRLKLDRRTVKARIDEDFLAELRSAE